MTEHQTTLLQLQDIFQQTSCCNTSPFFRITENRKFYVDCDEVYPNLFVGDESPAYHSEYLAKIGITHVLNMAEDDVDADEANPAFYRDREIKYLGVSIEDRSTEDIGKYFQTVSKFIQDGICAGGKVLVHCLAGYSRSPTCAIAFLIICESMSAVQACQTVKSKRECRPNDGFLQQLVDLDNQLSSK